MLWCSYSLSAYINSGPLSPQNGKVIQLITKFPTFSEFQFHHHVYWSLSGARQISSKHSHTDQFNITLQLIPMSLMPPLYIYFNFTCFKRAGEDTSLKIKEYNM